MGRNRGKPKGVAHRQPLQSTSSPPKQLEPGVENPTVESAVSNTPQGAGRMAQIKRQLAQVRFSAVISVLISAGAWGFMRLEEYLLAIIAIVSSALILIAKTVLWTVDSAWSTKSVILFKILIVVTIVSSGVGFSIPAAYSARKSGWSQMPKQLRWAMKTTSTDVRIAVQLLPCCRDTGSPDFKSATGAAITVQNLTGEVQKGTSATLSFPIISHVDVDDSERVKIIGGPRPGEGGGNYIQFLVPELEPDEVRKISVKFAYSAPFRSMAEWSKEYKYPPQIVVIGPGLLVLGPIEHSAK